MAKRDASESAVGGDGEWWVAIAGPGVVAVFAALTVPLVVGTLDARLYTPLAAPGYTLFVALSIVGERVVPQFTFRLYWGPFLCCCYALAVVVAGVVRAAIRPARTRRDADR